MIRLLQICYNILLQYLISPSKCYLLSEAITMIKKKIKIRKKSQNDIGHSIREWYIRSVGENLNKWSKIASDKIYWCIVNHKSYDYNASLCTMPQIKWKAPSRIEFYFIVKNYVTFAMAL